MAATQSEANTSTGGLKSAEDLPTLEIPTYATGDAAGLHFDNDPNDPFQRDILVQRRGRVNVGCDHIDIAHGYFSDDIDDLYTLIVVKFRFDPNGIAARIKEAHAVFKFAAMELGKPDPEVAAVFPDGSFFAEPTTQHEQVVKGLEGNAGGGAAGAQAGAAAKLEKTVDRDRTDFTRVIGNSYVADRNFGKKNAASWDFFENTTAKTGVVASLQGAILLKRLNMEPFKATISLETTADTTSRIASIFKKDEKDGDILYDPKRPSTNKLRKYDGDNLGKLDLASLSDVTLRTVLKNAVKEL